MSGESNIHSTLERLPWYSFDTVDNDFVLDNITLWWVVSVYNFTEQTRVPVSWVTDPFRSVRVMSDNGRSDLLILDDKVRSGYSEFLVEAMISRKTCCGGTIQLIWIWNDRFCVPIDYTDDVQPLLYPSWRILGEVKDKIIGMTL